MGKGDKKSKKGKQWRKSYGVSRNRNAIKARIKRSTTKKVDKAGSTEKAKPKRASRKKADS